MVMVTKVIQVVHRVVAGRRGRVVPVVGMMLRMVQQVMVVVVPDEHRSRRGL